MFLLFALLKAVKTLPVWYNKTNFHKGAYKHAATYKNTHVFLPILTFRFFIQTWIPTYQCMYVFASTTTYLYFYINAFNKFVYTYACMYVHMNEYKHMSAPNFSPFFFSEYFWSPGLMNCCRGRKFCVKFMKYVWKCQQKNNIKAKKINFASDSL